MRFGPRTRHLVLGPGRELKTTVQDAENPPAPQSPAHVPCGAGRWVHALQRFLGAVSQGPPAMSTMEPTAASGGRNARIGLRSAGTSSLPDTDGRAEVNTELAGLDSLHGAGAIRITQNSEEPARGREHGTSLLSGGAAAPEEAVASSRPLPAWALSLLPVRMGGGGCASPGNR